MKKLEIVGIINFVLNSVGVISYFSPYLFDPPWPLPPILFIYCFFGFFVGAFGVVISALKKDKDGSIKKRGLILNLISFTPYAVWLYFTHKGYILSV